MTFGTTTVLVATLALGMGVPSAQASNPAGIVLRPGLSVTFNIYGGKDTSGKALGDYQVFYTFTDATGGGYRFTYQFTSPGRFRGTMHVSAEDARGSAKARFYYGMGDSTRAGWTSLIRVSDATYSSVKAGRRTPLELDGPDNPRTIQKVGEDDLPVLVNERSVKLHALRTQSPDGGIFWILDDPAFPMMMQGAYGTRWTTTAINDPGLARQAVVESLTRSGQATTHAVLFTFDSAELAGGWKPVLDGVIDYLRANPTARIEVQGHTDNFGSAQYNLTLSQKRGDAVKAYLVGQGIAATRLVTKGYGAARSVADNSTPQGRALNRRVVFRVL